MRSPALPRRSLVALFAVAALLWQSVLPLLPAPRSGNAELLAICTEHGLRMVAVDAAAGSDGQSAPSGLPGKVDCPLCISLHSVAASPAGGAFALLSGLTAVNPAKDADSAASFAPAHHQLARAPPVIA